MLVIDGVDSFVGQYCDATFVGYCDSCWELCVVLVSEWCCFC